jgi:protein-disulfide isomerase
MAVFAPGAIALIALLAFNPFFIDENQVRLNTANAEEQAAPAQAVASVATANPLPEMALGKSDAPVTIVEYSSLSCPHCAAFHKEVMPELKSEYIDTGKVRYVEREFPLNDAAFGASVLARCVDPSRFFAFTDLLFSRQDQWAFKEDALEPLKMYAKQAGLTDEDFNKCLSDEELQKKIRAVRQKGVDEGVHGTPTFFINGKVFNGAPTFSALAEAIKPYLSTQ